ncbi:MAG: molybdopterin-containing oxidoreductase family protein [Chloroflexota bacterium]
MRNPSLTRRQFIAAAAMGSGALIGVGGQAFGSKATAQTQVEGGAQKSEGVPRLVPTLCGMCDANCGVLAYVQGDRLVKLEGNHSHSHSRGRICPRGSAGVKLLYDPDRLRQPLKRTPDGQYVPVTWKQALGEIGQALSQLRQQHGPQSLAWLRHVDAADVWERQFAAAFGTPNLFSTRAVGRGALDLASQATLGWTPLVDLERSRFLLLCGRNYAETGYPTDVEALFSAKEAGAKIVVVDPRLTSTAAQAREWLPIRPGTDGALLLGLMHVIVKERLYDQDFVEQHVVGFSQLAQYIADKTPSWAAVATDVPTDTIVRLAREMADAKPACAVDPGAHGAWGALYANSVNTARAALALNSLLGNYGAPGGLVRPTTSAALGQFSPSAVPAISAPRVDGADQYDASLGRASDGFAQKLPDILLTGKPYPIKALVVRHANPARSLPNSAKVREALGKLDLLVVIDTLPSDTAQLAHYVLPETTYLERLDPPLISRGQPLEVAIRQPVVEARFDSKPPVDIIQRLAGSVGLWTTVGFSVEDVAAAQLKPLGVDLAQLRARGVWRQTAVAGAQSLSFATPSGKVEVLSAALEAAGFDALPEYSPPLVRPDGGHSFRLLHGRESYHTGTGTQNNAWLHARARENRLFINADRAARLHIQDGDEVLARSEVGELRVRARVTQGIHPQAVFLMHGYGSQARAQRQAFGAGVNDNELVVDRSVGGSVSAAGAETIIQVTRVQG